MPSIGLIWCRFMFLHHSLMRFINIRSWQHIIFNLKRFINQKTFHWVEKAFFNSFSILWTRFEILQPNFLLEKNLFQICLSYKITPKELFCLVKSLLISYTVESYISMKCFLLTKIDLCCYKNYWSFRSCIIAHLDSFVNF